MDWKFDFRLHADPAALKSTQYFEFLPGPYSGKHWVPGARFIHEYTICLFEGIFESHAPEYDHFAGSIEIQEFEWKRILEDMAALRGELERCGDKECALLPSGRTMNLQDEFERKFVANQRSLAVLLFDLDKWLRETLSAKTVTILGM